MLYVLTNSFPTTVSGYSCRTHSLLSALTRSGISVAAATRTGYPASVGRWSPGDVDVIDGITYFRDLPWLPPMALSRKLNHRAIHLAGLVDRLRPAVIQATTDWENGLVARAVAQAHSIPWIYEMRGEREKSWVATFPPEQQIAAERSERFKLVRALETSLARDADAVIVLSEVQRGELIDRGVSPSRISVIPNGADTTTRAVSRYDRDTARAKLGLPGNFIFGTVTSLVDYEGLDLLITCLRDLLERGIEAHLVLAGSGACLPELRRRASLLGVARRCSFPGGVDPREVDNWYRSLDVFCMPRKNTSVTRSVTPMKSLAASALGIPVIASDLPALREVVPVPQAGTRLPAGAVEDWSVTLAEYARGTMSFDPNAAHAFAQSRTWDTAARNLTTIYREILGERR
nr:glycosyltransferase family 4 protein [Corynebacterium meridianum]